MPRQMVPTCFDALDAHVVGGAADRVALTGAGQSWTYARLLEEVAAFGGVLRHCGVAPGDRVVVALPAVPEAVVAVLACSRIGATHELVDAAAALGERAKVLVTASTESYVAEALDRGGRRGRRRAGQAAPRQRVAAGRRARLRLGRRDARGSHRPRPVPRRAPTVTPYDERAAAWLELLLDRETVSLA